MGAKQSKRDGRWHFRKQITLLDGTKKRIFGTPATNTKAAAEAAERAEIARYLEPEKAQARAQLAREATAGDSKSSVPTFRDYAPTVIKSYRPKGKRKGAATSDRSRAVLINGPLMRFFGSYRLDQIDQVLVDTAIKGWSGEDQTVNNRLSALSAVLRYAAQARLITRPELDLKVESRKIDESKKKEEIEAVPLADVDRLLAAARDKKHGFDYWLPAAVLLACDAGLRIGELRALQWTDVPDVRAHCVLTVRRSLSDQDDLGPPKNGKSREVPISSRLATELRKLPKIGLTVIARTRKKFAGLSLRYVPMLAAIKRLYSIAGVKMPRTLRTKRARPWHGLRHTFGTTLKARGASDSDLMEWMGHCDIRTSMIYVNPDAEAEAAAARARARAIAEAFG